MFVQGVRGACERFEGWTACWLQATAYVPGQGAGMAHCVVLLRCGVRLASESESACLAMCQAVGSRQQCYCKAQVSYLRTEGSCVVVEQCQVWLIVSTCCCNVLALLPVHILGHQSKAYFVLTSFDLLRRSAAFWVSWGERGTFQCSCLLETNYKSSWLRCETLSETLSCLHFFGKLLGCSYR